MTHDKGDFFLETEVIDKGVGIEEVALEKMNKWLLSEEEEVPISSRSSMLQIDEEDTVEIGFGLSIAKTLAKA